MEREVEGERRRVNNMLADLGKAWHILAILEASIGWIEAVVADSLPDWEGRRGRGRRRERRAGGSRSGIDRHRVGR